ncbi:hypothetical protein [Intrasporangium sp.]|uniref:hypothetical protein n=1 Tax=Intrasporangium sp. TaxID=1925024 RepID=UPI003221E376
MSTISSAQLLLAWEGTFEEQEPRRGASLLAGCRRDHPDAVARWSIRDRDRALFDLRTQLFGDRAVALVACPHCGEHLELPLELSLLRPRAQQPPPPFESHGWTAQVRPPTTDDLVAVAGCGPTDEDAALAALVERCVESLRRPDGTGAAVPEAPASVRGLLRLHLAEAVDDVDVELELCCAGCGRDLAAPFDIASFLLDEVGAWAARLLRDVHVIAGAYGWDEATILALSPRRRRKYLELIEAT